MAEGSITAAVHPLQEGMWFLQELYPGDAFYSWPQCYRIRGPLDVPRLRAALTALVRRHEALRTTFTAGRGRPQQVIHPPAPFALREIDARDVEPDRRDLLLSEAAAAQGSRVASLETGPLVWGELYHFDEDDFGLMLVFHHLIVDGWSLSIFYRQLSAGYRSQPGESGPQVQYRDFCAWYEGPEAAAERAGDLEFWRERLRDVPLALDLPADRPPREHPTHDGDNVPFAIEEAAAEQLRDLCGEEGCTLFMGLLAVFQILLYRTTDVPDACVSTPVSVREREQFEDVIGYFVNNVLTRADLAPGVTFREALRAARREVLAALQHRGTPFSRIVAGLPVRRALDGLVRANFQVYDASSWPELAGFELAGVEVRALPDQRLTARFDVEIRIASAVDAPPTGLLLYGTDRFDRSTAERLVEQYQSLLASAVADPDAPIGTLPAAPGTPAQRLGTGRPGSRHGLLERLLRVPSDEVALTWVKVPGVGQLTYGDLMARSAAVAECLRQHDARSANPVALVTELSADTVVGHVGALLATAPVVPLDADDPDLERHLARLRPAVVLTQSRLRRLLPVGDVRVVCIDDLPAGTGSAAVPQPGGDVVYVLTEGDDTVEVHATDLERLIEGIGPVLHREATPRNWAVCELDWPGVGIAVMWSVLLRGETLLLLAGPSLQTGEAATFLGQHQVNAVAGPADLLTSLSAGSGIDLILSPTAPTSTGDIEAELVVAAAVAPACLHPTTERPDRGDGAQIVVDVPLSVLDSAGRPCPAGIVGTLWRSGERAAPTNRRARWRVDGSLDYIGPVGRLTEERPAGAAPAASGGGAPLSPTEALIARAWAEALGFPPITADSNFFDLGGHSLLAAEIVARLRRETGKRLTLRAFLDAPDLARLAAALESLEDE